jgi:hypothetical protein
MVNAVVFFAVCRSLLGWWTTADEQIGQTAIEAYLTAFQRNTFDPFPVIASSFVRPHTLD